MAIEKLTENVEIVQTLSDYPNQEDGLSAEDLKAKFDQGPKVIKEYINNVLVPAVNNAEQNIERFPVDVVRYRAPQMLTENEKAQARENIGAAAAGADGSIVADAVLYTEQPLTLTQRAQARKNISAGLVADNYYYTEREELDANYPPDAENGYNALHEHINTLGADYVYSLYDALVTKYPDYVQMNELTDNGGASVLREYVINCNTKGTYTHDRLFEEFEQNDPARKPKYLIVTGIHGTERNAVFSAYRFVHDMVNGHNVPRAFRDGAVLHVIPVADTAGFKAFRYNLGIAVDKNFDWEWDTADPDYDESVWGKSAASKPETQAITKWLHENSDAVAFINLHNNGILNENVIIVGPADDEVDRIKRAAMRGVDRIIPYWKNVIGYPNVEIPTTTLIENPNHETDPNQSKYIYETLPNQPVIFSYAVNGVSDASSVGYAINKVGIPSIFVETLCYYGDFSSQWCYDAPGEYNTGYSKPFYQPEVIAMGAEALGNILIELYSEASEVKDMAGVNDKLDTLIGEDMVELNGKLDALMGQINSGFHAVSGTLNITNPQVYHNGTSYVIGIACPKGAKTIAVYPDDPTLSEILASKKANCFGSFIGNFFAPDAGIILNGMKGQSYLTMLQQSGSNWYLLPSPNSVANNNPDSDKYGVTINAAALQDGTYHWEAYYWNEGEAIPAWTGGSY